MGPDSTAVQALLVFHTLPTRYVLQPVDPNARYKLRRAEAQQRRHKQRLIAAGALLALIAAGVVGGVIATHVRGHKTVRAAARSTPAPKTKQAQVLQPRPLPAEVRGVHVTMALAGLPGKIEQYIAMKADGLNAIELDVKDENGEVGFPVKVPLARKVGSARAYYDVRKVVAKIHAAGLYLVGRVVTFEDPLLSAGAPQLAIRRADGSRWLTSGGLGWTNPYDKRVWKYNVDIAVQAAKLGFDEIQFDYVRFPSDGDLSQIRYPGAHTQPMGWTVPMFVKYARSRLKPLGVASRSTSSACLRRATSGSASSRAGSRGTWTRSTRWSIRRITSLVSTTSSIPIRGRGRLSPTRCATSAMRCKGARRT